PDQQTKQDEVCRFLSKRYQQLGWQRVATTQMPTGTVVDWFNPASVPGSQEPPPPPPADMQLSPDAQLQVTELDMHPELSVPGMIPVIRPMFASYVMGNSGATSVEDFVHNYQQAGQPNGVNRLYGGLPYVKDNHGASAWLNQFVGDVEPGTFSLIEVA